MDDEVAAAVERLQRERVRCDELKVQWAGLRSFHRGFLWLHRFFMLLDLVLIIWNVATIADKSTNLVAWVNGAFTGFLCWAFCNTWRVSESRWRDYLNELMLIEESARSIDATIARVRELHAHQN
jgi:hypothetical protein